MKNKSTLVRIGFLGGKIAAEAGDIAGNIYKSTSGLMNDISRSISKIDLSDMYKESRKTFKIARKRGNRFIKRTVKDFRKSDFYSAMNTYMLMVRKWSAQQIRSIRKFSASSYKGTRRWLNKAVPRVKSWAGKRSYNFQSWVSDQYPKVRSFVKQNYPGMQSFVLTQLPLYRAALGR